MTPGRRGMRRAFVLAESRRRAARKDRIVEGPVLVLLILAIVIYLLIF